LRDPQPIEFKKKSAEFRSALKDSRRYAGSI